MPMVCRREAVVNYVSLLFQTDWVLDYSFSNYAVKAAGGVKLGAAAAAMTAAATAAVSGSKQEEKKDGSQQLSSK